METIQKATINKRLLTIGDRVKCFWWKEPSVDPVWITGTVHSFMPTRNSMFKIWFDKFSFASAPGYVVVAEKEKSGITSVVYDDYNKPRVIIKTNEKITEKENQLFDGFGLHYGSSGNVIFEHEEEYDPFPAKEEKGDEKIDSSDRDDLPF